MKNTTKPSFKKGDRVTWTSQASGFKKKKTGVVIAVIAPSGYPDRFYGGKRFNHRQYQRLGMQRDHKSYIIDVDGKLYWPLVKNLKLVRAR